MLSLSIALRYLFSRTRLHAVNYVTALSAIAIAVVAMALVAVVGVYNGYVAMILDATAQVDADIVLKDASGAVFDLHDLPDYRRQLIQSGAEAITLRLESKGLLRVGEQPFIRWRALPRFPRCIPQRPLPTAKASPSPQYK